MFAAWAAFLTVKSKVWRQFVVLDLRSRPQPPAPVFAQT